MHLLWFIVGLLLFPSPAEFIFLKGCNSGGSCINEKWRNATHWGLVCMEWMEMKKNEVDKCRKPWKCCHTAEYQKKIKYSEG
ncbi:uncharacterized protein LOC108034981 [Drosophila biarmipes]|uniref:uncharacterized protein LOC108034981 n=1 Tax=Drosophila biarmipes TaxID=125945 RepID=UPI0007E6E905|nr:uncharacterized protein LOC108034981 [Drosophila biarmipes]